ncbi:hypothetical protein PIB30_100691, partial [Stylosanthes scabra]|nr:hypothetical protein [Stylosanthes scabra]
FVLSSIITITKFNFSNSIAVLDLSWNTFTSHKILSWVSSFTPKLVDLDLSANNLKGSSNMSTHSAVVMNSLEQLDLSSNGFQGGDLKSFMNTSMMNSLEQLDLHSNELNGEDLKSFMNACSLHSLNMGSTNLSQDLPSILGNLSLGCIRYSLQELDFSSNSITGTLSGLSKFRLLKRVDLSYNQLSGKIPEDAKLPPHLEYVSMESNSLEGSIPTSVFENTCNLSSLKLDYV